MTTESAHDPIAVIADLLASTILGDFERYKRKHLYVWEMRGCELVLDHLDAGAFCGNMWTADFVRLNRDAIRAGKSEMNLNLRDARLNPPPPQAKGD